MEKIKDLMNMETVRMWLWNLGKNGLKGPAFKVPPQKLQGLDNDYDYGEWYELTRPKEGVNGTERDEVRAMSRWYPSSFRPTRLRRSICGR